MYINKINLYINSNNSKFKNNNIFNIQNDSKNVVSLGKTNSDVSFCGFTSWLKETFSKSKEEAELKIGKVQLRNKVLQKFPKIKKTELDAGLSIIKNKAQLELANVFMPNDKHMRTFSGILINTTSVNLEFAKKLYNSNRRQSYSNPSILANLKYLDDAYKIPFAEKLCFDDKFKKHHKYIDSILSVINRYNIELAEKICLVEEKNSDLLRIISSVSENNLQLAKKLYDCPNPEKYKDVDKSSILSMTKYHNGLAAIVEQLIDDKEFPNTQIEHVLRYLEPKNREYSINMIKKLYKANYPQGLYGATLALANTDKILDKVISMVTNFREKYNGLHARTLLNIISSLSVQNLQIQNDKLDFINLNIEKSEKPEKIYDDIMSTAFQSIYYYKTKSNIEKTEMDDNYKKQLEKSLNHKELYVNGDYLSPDEMKKNILYFFNEHKYTIKTLSDIIGTDALDDLLRNRLNDAEYYLNSVNHYFSQNDLQLLKLMANSKKPNGSSFISTEKVNMIDTLIACKQAELNTHKIWNNIKSGVLDIDKVHMTLLREVFLDKDYSQAEIDAIPKEKLALWNLKYINHLTTFLSTSREAYMAEGLVALGDFIRFANSPKDFLTLIHYSDIVYGKANNKTKKEFQKLGMNYKEWINSKVQTNFKTKDKNEEYLQQISSQTVEDINSLRSTPAKKYIDKIFHKFIKEDKFYIPSEILNNKEKFENFVKNILTQLNMLWKRAELNKDSQNITIANMAKNTLMIKSHLEQRIRDINVMNNCVSEKALDWTIKLWDRIPQKDLFQGNYSTCCIGIGEINGWSMPLYLLNTMFNMIEIVDNKTGETVGNALCYYSKNDKDKPVFSIDNIEIANKHKLSQRTSINLRNAIVQFAKELNSKVTNNENTSIILGCNFNDISTADLQEKLMNISRIGAMSCEEVYLDLFFHGGYSDDKENVSCYILN